MSSTIRPFPFVCIDPDAWVQCTQAELQIKEEECRLLASMVTVSWKPPDQPPSQVLAAVLFSAVS